MDTRGQKEQKYGQNVHGYGQNVHGYGQNVHEYGQNARRRPRPAQTKPQAKHGLNRKARLTLRPAEPSLAARAETIFRHKSHRRRAAAANIAPRTGRPAKRMIIERTARGFHSQSLSRKRPEKATKRPRVASLILEEMTDNLTDLEVNPIIKMILRNGDHSRTAMNRQGET